MPLVSEFQRDPAKWSSVGISYGFVRDGDRLRVARVGKGQNAHCEVISLEAWREGGGMRRRFDRERSRARTVTGLAPDRVMIRLLKTPLTDPRKAEEVWPALLDAALSFPLEHCQVVFLPARPAPGGGLICLAAAARTSDLEPALEEWRELGIEPDLCVPETLLLPRQGGGVCWTGGARRVMAAWNNDEFLAGSGCPTGEQGDRAWRRFQASWEERVEPSGWEMLDADETPALERAAAATGLRPHPSNANLAAGPFASDLMRKRFRAWRRKMLGMAAAGTVIFLSLAPAARWMIHSREQTLISEMGAIYESLTGRPVSQPGQERLFAERYIESEWGDLLARDSAPAVQTRTLEDAFGVIAESELSLLSLRVRGGEVELTGAGPEERLNDLIELLRERGLDLAPGDISGGRWTLEGRVSP